MQADPPADPEMDTALLIYGVSDPKGMGRPGVLLLAAALLPLLAGCFGGPASPPAPPSALATPAADLQPGFYAFQHGGGDLVFSVPANGSAEVVLYGADDLRVGHIGLGAEQASGRFVLDGLDAGELVVDLLSVNGTLDVRSGGEAVPAFRPMPSHVERHVLVSRPSQTSLPLPLGDPLDETLNVSLLRAPTELRVIGNDATFQDLSILVTGRGGVVYEVELGPNTPVGFTQFSIVLPGESYPENVRDGELRVEMHSSAFDGTLVLEASSFSRATVDDGGAHATLDVPRFTYGALPDAPVSFEVREGATQVYLWVEDSSSETSTASSRGSSSACSARSSTAAACKDERPAVALFGPHDERVATVLVPVKGTVAVPVPEAGKWVAVLLRGDATLGADAVPGDFELRPLDTVDASTPSGAAGGSDGSYGESREPLAVQGVPFHVAYVREYAGSGIPAVPELGLGCGEGTLAILRDGETIAAWGYADDSDGDDWTPDLYLGAGSLEAVHADYGDTCDRLVAVTTGYER